MAAGWPARLSYGPVGLRPLRASDGSGWQQVRRRNEQWLAPWEGAPAAASRQSWPDRHTQGTFLLLLRAQRREARAGRALPFVVTYEGRLAGQLTLSSLVRGAYDGATVGYWVDRDVAGRGVLPTALALAADHAFGPVGLHRLEANVRPENGPSLRVVEKLGFRSEGRRARYLHIDGDWRDHLSFALLREDAPGGVLRRYLAGLPGR